MLFRFLIICYKIRGDRQNKRGKKNAKITNCSNQRVVSCHSHHSPDLDPFLSPMYKVIILKSTCIMAVWFQFHSMGMRQSSQNDFFRFYE